MTRKIEVLHKTYQCELPLKKASASLTGMKTRLRVFKASPCPSSSSSS